MEKSAGSARSASGGKAGRHLDAGVSYSNGLPTCRYCFIAEDDAWVLTEFVVAFPHPDPLATCHVIVAPRRHVRAFYDLDVQEQRMLWNALGQLRERIMASLNVEGFAAGFVDAAAGDDGSAHAYVHLIPRIPGEWVELPGDAEWVDLGLPEGSQ